MQDLYIGNYITLLKEIIEKLNKWKAKWHSWVEIFDSKSSVFPNWFIDSTQSQSNISIFGG